MQSRSGMKRDTEVMYASMRPWNLFFFVALPGMISMFAMSVSTALVFPVIILGACWGFGLDGIWLNFVGVKWWCFCI